MGVFSCGSGQPGYTVRSALCGNGAPMAGGQAQMNGQAVPHGGARHSRSTSTTGSPSEWALDFLPPPSSRPAHLCQPASLRRTKDSPGSACPLRLRYLRPGRALMGSTPFVKKEAVATRNIDNSNNPLLHKFFLRRRTPRVLFWHLGTFMGDPPFRTRRFVKDLECGWRSAGVCSVVPGWGGRCQDVSLNLSAGPGPGNATEK